MSEIHRRPIRMSIFSNVAQYNARGVRHPLPDLDLNTAWDTRYSGQEAPTLLPDDLQEDTARDFIMAVARFRDYRKHADTDPDSACNRLDHAPTPVQVLLFKAIAPLSLTDESLCAYLTKTLMDNGLKGTRLLYKLGDLGIRIETDKSSKFGAYIYKPAPSSLIENLAASIGESRGASYLGYMMAHFNSVKARSAHAPMFYIGDALDRSQILAPGFYQSLAEIKNAYRETGMESAAAALRELVRHSPTPHPAQQRQYVLSPSAIRNPMFA